MKNEIKWRCQLLSVKKSYRILLERAAIVVDLFGQNGPETIKWDLANKSKLAVIALTDRTKEISCFEIGIRKRSPYTDLNDGHKFKQDRRPAISKRGHDTNIKITPQLWEYIKSVIYSFVERETKNRPGNGWKGVGKSFWNSKRTLVIYEKRAPFSWGYKITIDSQDKELLRLFLQEEAKGAYWQRRIGWFAKTTNSLMRNTKTLRARGIKSLCDILNDDINAPFLRENIMEEILPRIHQHQRERFLDFLERERFIKHEKRTQYNLLNSKPCKKMGASFYLNYVLRGRRKKTGAHIFEVFSDSK